MGESKSELDAHEPATAHKLDQAHEKGQIFRSGELTFAAVMVACVACVYGLGARVIDSTGLMLRQSLTLSLSANLTGPTAPLYAQALLWRALTILGPVLFTVWLAALLTGALQAHGVLSAEPLKPDFNRLSPATGFKRIFSTKTLHDLWRSGAKLLAIFASMGLWGYHHWNELVHLPAHDPHSLLSRGIALLGSSMSMLAGILCVFALLDWLFNRWDYLRRMRMSRREIKDERKELEGDPRIKSRLRELRLQWLKRSRQLANVRSADVLVTNPTHVAVALEYRHGEMPAPMITARGAGELAHRMRQEARRRAVPVVENPPLARELFAVHESQTFVPERHFNQVARILRWVYAARGMERRGLQLR